MAGEASGSGERGGGGERAGGGGGGTVVFSLPPSFISSTLLAALDVMMGIEPTSAWLCFSRTLRLFWRSGGCILHLDDHCHVRCGLMHSHNSLTANRDSFHIHCRPRPRVIAALLLQAPLAKHAMPPAATAPRSMTWPRSPASSASCASLAQFSPCCSRSQSWTSTRPPPVLLSHGLPCDPATTP